MNEPAALATATPTIASGKHPLSPKVSLSRPQTTQLLQNHTTPRVWALTD